MGMFSSLFGSSGSDKADKLRQQAIDAFNNIKSPELADLQIKLNDYVNQGVISPEQAEAQLMQSNAFNDIVLDPANSEAQKMALTQLQQIGSEGGMTAVDKAQLQDITNEQNQTAKSRNASIMQNAQERGMGNSGIAAVNQLMSEQSAADRASQQGTQVAANAQLRALQAMQAAGQLGGQMEDRQYGQASNKAQAQNAIDQFNAQALNGTNMANVQAKNAAQAANVANAQNIANMNTQTQNQNKQYNSQQVQNDYNNKLQKAQGVSGTLNNWANDATAQAKAETGADMALTSGLIQAGATAFGGPIAGMAAGQTTSGMQSAPSGYDPKMAANQYARLGYSDGGIVKGQDKDTPAMSDEAAFSAFMSGFNPKKNKDTAKLEAKKEPEDDKNFFSRLSSVISGNADKSHEIDNYADGGVIKEKRKNTIPINYNEPEGKWDVTTSSNTPGGSYQSYIEAAQQAEVLKKLAEQNKMASGGPICMDDGGKVPGKAEVPGDSMLNDKVPAMLSPGEVVMPRTMVDALRNLMDPNRGAK